MPILTSLAVSNVQSKAEKLRAAERKSEQARRELDCAIVRARKSCSVATLAVALDTSRVAVYDAIRRHSEAPK